MSFTKKILICGAIVLVIGVGIFYLNHKNTNTVDQSSQRSGGKQTMNLDEKSEQEKAEAYAEKMKPKIKEELKKEDIYHFIKDIKFNEKVTISPMGMIEVTGYINNEPEKFTFDASLYYKSNEVDSIGYSKEVGDRFTDWSKYSKKEKEEYIKTAYPDKKEREQYLKDIGELK
ncbi:DUF1433 domain-containing protein [Bacillus mojavensis]|uniref:DUF1433 domain-containing protein n=1 Tax=Bacillus mojavensis TaxID=72360 RepID=UPI002DBB4E38|nr:DUF1433 domain-containing protein [Bacillus mojavensis]MEC1611786.1 DUF1433 domain-containing protein [Bacillus mojavensis]MEC1690808.1 DUF1433 domain-containing protein [Bacillus mojavensis]MEC1732349.1 DUF1433 domain-containing protein [Bacillus mojavensis]MED1006301.1 DUF1433 domain-containing protein [Bacillus mojavensis]